MNGKKYKTPQQRRTIFEQWADRFKVGDHLVTPRNLHGISYTHHGIYIGNCEVIHYSGFSRGPESGPVSLTWIDDFANNESVDVKYYPRYDSVRRYEAIQTAYSFLGERKYCLVRRNCEHFVTYCITGEATSLQVRAWVNRLLTGAGFIAGSTIGLPTYIGRQAIIHLAATVGRSIIAKNIATNIALRAMGGTLSGGLTNTIFKTIDKPECHWTRADSRRNTKLRMNAMKFRV